MCILREENGVCAQVYLCVYGVHVCVCVFMRTCISGGLLFFVCVYVCMNVFVF